MNTLIAAAIRCVLIFLLPTVAYSISAQWDQDPISGDWNTAANWTPMGVPNGPTDIATFALSKNADVSISANTEVNGITFTSAATNPYTITASPGLTLTISGVGITNNSGRTQNFVTLDDASGNVGTIVFSHHATAGSNVSISNEGGSTNFLNRSTAGSAGFSNVDGGTINFFNRSTAGNATIRDEVPNVDNGGTINFFDRSTAGNATIRDDFGIINFFNRSTAGNATIRDDFGNGSLVMNFFNRSTAGNSTIINENTRSFLQFANNSTAGNSEIVATHSSTVQFLDNSTAGSASIVAADGSSLQFANNSTAASANIFTGFFSSISFGGSSRGGHSTD